MRFGLVIFWCLVLSTVIQSIAWVRRSRREREIERVINEVHEVLQIWAITWVDPDVREKLLKVFRHPIDPR